MPAQEPRVWHADRIIDLVAGRQTGAQAAAVIDEPLLARLCGAPQAL